MADIAGVLDQILAAIEAPLLVNATLYFDTTATNAFVDGANAAALQAYPGEIVEFTDSAGNCALAKIGAAGTVKATTELLADTGFDSDPAWTKEAGWAVAGSKATATGVANAKYVYQSIAAKAGSLVELAVVCDSFTSGNYFAGAGVGGYGTIRTASGSFTESVTRGTGTTIGISASSLGLTASFTSLSALEVTAPSANGVLLTALDGVTRSFISKDALWSPNRTQRVQVVGVNVPAMLGTVLVQGGLSQTLGSVLLDSDRRVVLTQTLGAVTVRGRIHVGPWVRHQHNVILDGSHVTCHS